MLRAIYKPVAAGLLVVGALAAAAVWPRILARRPATAASRSWPVATRRRIAVRPRKRLAAVPRAWLAARTTRPAARRRRPVASKARIAAKSPRPAATRKPSRPPRAAVAARRVRIVPPTRRPATFNNAGGYVSYPFGHAVAPAAACPFFFAPASAYVAVAPPSITITWPVTYEASSDARYSAAKPISSGWPK